MCGIAGKVNADAARPVDAAVLRRMCAAMAHRGPDDEGIRVDGRVGLGMRRLKVIDLDTGAQPMGNEDGSLSIVFNGEIYNYRQLRQDLRARGHALVTASDTETILHLYEDYGADCVRHLRGMFAFAIWDSAAERLFIARDRLGKKPLYYSQIRGSLVFASELSALIQEPAVDTRIDPHAIDEYLSYLFIPHPRTIYRGARKMPPASYLIYEHGQVTVARYWNVRYDAPVAQDLDTSVEQLDEILRQAVSLRLLADVPVGAFLSGGLDSSLIVAMMQRLSDRPVRTFSIGFAQSSFDETTHARRVAGYLGTQHQEYRVHYDVQELLPRLIRHFGEPYGDSSAIPAYHLARMTREDVTVALSGDGGDEVFGGYRRYRARQLAAWYNRWPGWAGRGVFEHLVSSMREPDGYYGQSARKKTKRFVEFARMVREQPQTSWAFFFTEADKTLLYTEKFSDTLTAEPAQSSLAPYFGELAYPSGERWVETLQGVKEQAREHRWAGATGAPGGCDGLAWWGPDGPHGGEGPYGQPGQQGRLERPRRPDAAVQNMMWLDLMTYLPDDILTKVDRTSMACSLEVRSPLLDQAVVEFAARLPLAHKLRGRQTKVILRRLAQRYLPPEILQRPKQGFAVPLGGWLRGELRGWMAQVLLGSDAPLANWFQPDRVQAMISAHHSGRRDYSQQLWALCMLGLWLTESPKRMNETTS